MHYNIIC